MAHNPHDGHDVTDRDIALRKHANWMAHLDERVLEYLAVNDAQRSRTIRDAFTRDAGDLTYPQQYIDQRCETLEAYGLLEYDDSARTYAVSYLGEEYLAGTLDASKLDRDGKDTGSDGTLDVV